jgi:ParB family transcriptional regulator, chromosome partitioning protein
MARKNLLGALMAPKAAVDAPASATVETKAMGELPAGNPSGDQTGEGPRNARASASAMVSQGAIGAVSRSIEQLKQQVTDANRIHERLTAGQTIVELDPAAIDGSPVADRMAAATQAHDELRASIAAHGQHAPILVRPHPAAPGRFQVAYGHRRLQAAADLGRTVRAVVRVLTDVELVIAQGVENSARADLSFIERAVYADRLEKAGFTRDTIMAALSIDKTALSKLIAVPNRLPAALLAAIGPAPKIGRDRWLALAELMAQQGAGERVSAAIAGAAFAQADTDQRFELALKAAGSRPKPRTAARPAAWRDGNGVKVGQISDNPGELVVTVSRKAVPGFAEFVRDAMPGLLSAFQGRNRDVSH